MESIVVVISSGIHHEKMIKTHLLPVVAVEYSECFKQIITAGEDSVCVLLNIVRIPQDAF